MENFGNNYVLIGFIILLLGVICWFIVMIILLYVKKRNTWYTYKGAKYRIIYYNDSLPTALVENENGKRFSIPKKEIPKEFVPVNKNK